MENWVRLQLSHCWWAWGKSRGAGSRAERQPSTAPSGCRAVVQRLGLAPGLTKARLGFAFGRGWRGCCAVASRPAAETMSGPRHWLETIPDGAGWGQGGRVSDGLTRFESHSLWREGYFLLQHWVTLTGIAETGPEWDLFILNPFKHFNTPWLCTQQACETTCLTVPTLFLLFRPGCFIPSLLQARFLVRIKT